MQVSRTEASPSRSAPRSSRISPEWTAAQVGELPVVYLYNIDANNLLWILMQMVYNHVFCIHQTGGKLFMSVSGVNR
jgi:hypothetical protein